jgi:hypothetical protein
MSQSQPIEIEPTQEEEEHKECDQPKKRKRDDDDVEEDREGEDLQEEERSITTNKWSTETCVNERIRIDDTMKEVMPKLQKEVVKALVGVHQELKQLYADVPATYPMMLSSHIKEACDALQLVVEAQELDSLVTLHGPAQMDE